MLRARVSSSPDEDPSTGDSTPDSPDGVRQRVTKVAGSRRARPEPVPGTDTSPDIPVRDEPRPAHRGTRGDNDERLWGDVPPHW